MSANDIDHRAEVHSFDGILSDMDGTIIDSTNAIIKHWHRIGNEIGVDPNEILASSHGRRSIDVLELYDSKLATWQYVQDVEGRIPIEFGHDAEELPGSRALLDQLQKTGSPWSIVTSGTRPLVTGWLKIMKLAMPETLVAAEDVKYGKPDPACYALGASKLGLNGDASILVLEDSPAGVRSGKAAGCKVLAVATTHTLEQLQQAGADWVVQDLRALYVHSYDKNTHKIKVEISGILYQ